MSRQSRAFENHVQRNRKASSDASAASAAATSVARPAARRPTPYAVEPRVTRSMTRGLAPVVGFEDHLQRNRKASSDASAASAAATSVPRPAARRPTPYTIEPRVTRSMTRGLAPVTVPGPAVVSVVVPAPAAIPVVDPAPSVVDPAPSVVSVVVPAPDVVPVVDPALSVFSVPVHTADGLHIGPIFMPNRRVSGASRALGAFGAWIKKLESKNKNLQSSVDTRAGVPVVVPVPAAVPVVVPAPSVVSVVVPAPDAVPDVVPPPGSRPIAVLGRMWQKPPVATATAVSAVPIATAILDVPAPTSRPIAVLGRGWQKPPVPTTTADAVAPTATALKRLAPNIDEEKENRARLQPVEIHPLLKRVFERNTGGTDMPRAAAPKRRRSF